ncbi:MAG TPA: DUF6350 family protein, partial [Terrimesophilobacter sp.]|nr:DUF6350 family protein [Terrimesophilobacter sp.]
MEHGGGELAHHGVDVHVVLAGDSGELFGLVGVPAFDVTIAALGFSLVTLLLAVRAGRRIGASSFWRVGLLTAGVTFAALSLGVVVSATHPVAVPSLVQGVLFPTVIFMVGLVVGLQRAMVRRTADQGGVPLTALSDLVRRIPHHVRVVVGAAVRGGLAAVAGVMVVSAVACAALIGVRYAEIVALYESVHTGVLGGIALTLGQLVLTPNLVLWAAAWFVGPGFAIGAGSSVAPLCTSLGTVPAIPVLGAVLVEASAWGFVGLVV